MAAPEGRVLASRLFLLPLPPRLLALAWPQLLASEEGKMTHHSKSGLQLSLAGLIILRSVPVFSATCSSGARCHLLRSPQLQRVRLLLP